MSKMGNRPAGGSMPRGIGFFWNLILIPFLFVSVVLHGQTRWQEVTTVEEACKAYPGAMEDIFNHLNLDREELAKVRKAYLKGDLTKACTALLAYYKGTSRALELKKEVPRKTEKRDGHADSLLLDIFTFQRVTGKVPRSATGNLEWSFEGPENDVEWAWALNRHYPVNELLEAWYQTGNPVYARYIDLFIRDWIVSSWPYPGVRSNTALWRGLEVSFRVKTWARVFYGLIYSESLTPATRLLILSSLPWHAHYARSFHAQNNWLTMEMSGLATVATAWPEFRDADQWLAYSVSAMTESLKEQVYPDGAQTELTSHYHLTALSNFSLFADICRNAGRQLPGDFILQIEKMWNYLACTLRPDGHGLLNNDGDLDYNRERVIKAADWYGRSDWTYIATNGSGGKKPESGPSFLFPWAGQLISRSGYDSLAHWSFFDFGPWGSGHQHNDKLHLSVSAWGRDLLVDAGRFAYRGEVAERFRGYALGSQSHNLLLVDGKGEGPGIPVAADPVPATEYQVSDSADLARGSFSDFRGIEGVCRHTRTLLYLRGKCWVVVDKIETDRPRKIDALWHWHPRCTILTDSIVCYSANEKGNLQIVPAGKRDWNLQIVKGVSEPAIQGWYSRAYNCYEPSPVAVYSTEIERDTTFVWVLFPTEKVSTAGRADLVSLTGDAVKLNVTSPDGTSFPVHVPLTGNSVN